MVPALLFSRVFGLFTFTFKVCSAFSFTNSHYARLERSMYAKNKITNENQRARETKKTQETLRAFTTVTAFQHTQTLRAFTMVIALSTHAQNATK